ncbi:UvrD-helicase domain-containing protein [Deinococcus fonticola]|uniref:UvrD-helicase domain-containing protein n=1 Tax=Deinococcus fonticola TaxID=2528713 RepID=UPI0010752ECB|nr:UvrD-helicase domain-containing protein [Deinococcus fonticola]
MKSIDQYVTPTFESEQAALPTRVHKRVQKAITVLKEDPQNQKQQLDVKKLEAIDALRIKVDDYRVIYRVEGNAQTFISVLPRKDVYKKLGIPDEDTLKIVPDVELRTVAKPTRHGALPHELTADLLTSWRIPAECQSPLTACATEDHLLEVKVPYPVFSRVVDLLYSKKWQERLAQPQYVLTRPTDLEDLAEGRLTTRLLRLDDHQRQVSSLHLEGGRTPMVVKGGPGSGKSTVALYRAKLLVERYPDAAIAYTTYTNALAEASKEQLKILLPEDFSQVRVGTVDSLARHWLGTVEKLPSTILGATSELTMTLFEEILADKPKQLARYSASYLLAELFDVIEVAGLTTEAEYLASPRHGRKSPISSANRKLIWGLYEALEAKIRQKNLVTWAGLRQRTLHALEEGKLHPPYDYLIVDEAQDLSPITIRMLASMVKTPGGLYITADANQTLYESSFSWDALKQGWPQAEVHALKKNYRNTAQIVRAVADVREALNLQDEEAALDEGAAQGPKPRKVYATAETEVDALVDFIREASRESREPQRNAAILVAGEKLAAAREGARLSKELKSRKLKANYMSSKDLRLDADCIKIITMHTSKGLEFPIVALWNVTDGVLPRDVSDLPSEEQTEEELKDRRLFYVGCSRAMRHLAVFTRSGEESPFVYDLQDDHWETQEWSTT